MITKVEIEKLFKNIKVIKEFPRSGQKKVILVDHPKYGKTVMKIVEGEDERVKREVEIVTKYNITNVPKLYEFEKINNNGEIYLISFEQNIEGQTLTNKLKKGKLTTVEGIKLLGTLLNIAVELEKVNIVHRDIKPDNIICEDSGKYYLIDFGIARKLDMKSLTMTKAEVGPHTPGYGAPELFQYSKRDIDIRADLFSIGVVLFESLTGKHPFITGDEMNVNEIWYKTRTVMPKEYKIEGDTNSQLISFIETLMQKHINRRPPDAKKALEWFEIIIKTIDIKE